MSPGLLTPPRCTDRPVWASPMWGYRDLPAVAVGGPEPAEGARLARADLVVVGEEKIPYAKKIGEGVTPGGFPLFRRCARIARWCAARRAGGVGGEVKITGTATLRSTSWLG